MIKNTSVTLFEERINFNEIRTERIENELIVLFSAALKDTYKDGVINLNDLKSLFIYSLTDKSLRKISEDNLDVQHFDFEMNNKDLIIRFGIDYDNDGKYNSYTEPSIIKKYDYKNDKLIDVVDQKTNKELQHLLEGTK